MMAAVSMTQAAPWMGWQGNTWSSDCCWVTTCGYSYVSSRGVAHRVTIAGGKRARAGVKEMPERTDRKMASCPARRLLTSSPRARGAASNAKSAGAVAGPTDAKAIREPTTPKLACAKE